MVGSSQVALRAQLAPAALERSVLAYVVAKLPDSTWVHLIAADGQVWKAKLSSSQGKPCSQPKRTSRRVMAATSSAKATYSKGEVA